ncbi:BrnT family toxin [Desulfobacter latus]|uniref:BrnT family toxin n=1 Tax=Desulfobacter latus TaxID=2292 RepID=A0A850T3M9_9BACT|nr:BrnT family toxin [Desulfobacter latus]NWH03812.1 BrnT family toxin [Desulfobacter latus]
MNKLIFEWDDTKNKINLKKHGVSFEEAQTVFFDDNAIEFDDPDHSLDEERYLLLGFSQSLKILVVCHCYRGSESTIRIISARKATKKEQKAYYR